VLERRGEEIGVGGGVLEQDNAKAASKIGGVEQNDGLAWEAARPLGVWLPPKPSLHRADAASIALCELAAGLFAVQILVPKHFIWKADASIAIAPASATMITLRSIGAPSVFPHLVFAAKRALFLTIALNRS